MLYEVITDAVEDSEAGRGSDRSTPGIVWLPADARNRERSWRNSPFGPRGYPDPPFRFGVLADEGTLS